jgi:hypothetical protein
MMMKHVFHRQGCSSTKQQRTMYRGSPRPTAQGASAYFGMPAPPSPFPLADTQLPRPHLIPSILQEMATDTQLYAPRRD